MYNNINTFSVANQLSSSTMQKVRLSLKVFFQFKDSTTQKLWLVPEMPTKMKAKSLVWHSKSHIDIMFMHIFPIFSHIGPNKTYASSIPYFRSCDFFHIKHPSPKVLYQPIKIFVISKYIHPFTLTEDLFPCKAQIWTMVKDKEKKIWSQLQCGNVKS